MHSNQSTASILSMQVGWRVFVLGAMRIPPREARASLQETRRADHRITP
jgi:hypothetical protein